MKLSLNFADGTNFTQDLTEFQELLKIQESGSNVLGYILAGKEKNSTITLNDTSNGKTIIKKYDDLKSLEIMF